MLTHLTCMTKIVFGVNSPHPNKQGTKAKNSARTLYSLLHQPHRPVKQQTSLKNKTVVQRCSTGGFDTQSHLLRYAPKTTPGNTETFDQKSTTWNRFDVNLNSAPGESTVEKLVPSSSPFNVPKVLRNLQNPRAPARVPFPEVFPYIAETVILLQRQWLVQHEQKSFVTSTNNMFCLFGIMKLVSSVAGNLSPMLLAKLYCNYSS